MKYLVVVLIIFFNMPSFGYEVGKETGLKIPRFVSLKSDNSNLRIGSDEKYPKILTYNVKNFPLEIIEEHKQWRKIIDIDKNQGWIHRKLLKGNRYGIINTPYKESAHIFNKPEGRLVGKIGKKNIVKINKCLIKWCHISLDNNNGWILKINLWGVYDNEVFNIPFYQTIINFYWKLNINI